MLLGAEDRPRPRDSDPPDEGLRRDLVVFHAVEADEGAGATEACLAVDGDGTSLGIRKLFLACVHEILNNLLGWSGPIHEDHVVVGDAVLREGSLVVLGIIQADNATDVKVLEYFGVAGGGVPIATLLSLVSVHRSHKGYKLAWDNPVKVSIRDLLIVFVLASIKLIVIVPS